MPHPALPHWYLCFCHSATRIGLGSSSIINPCILLCQPICIPLVLLHIQISDWTSIHITQQSIKPHSTLLPCPHWWLHIPCILPYNHRCRWILLIGATVVNAIKIWTFEKVSLLWVNKLQRKARHHLSSNPKRTISRKKRLSVQRPHQWLSLSRVRQLGVLPYFDNRGAVLESDSTQEDFLAFIEAKSTNKTASIAMPELNPFADEFRFAKPSSKPTIVGSSGPSNDQDSASQRASLDHLIEKSLQSVESWKQSKK